MKVCFLIPSELMNPLKFFAEQSWCTIFLPDLCASKSGKVLHGWFNACMQQWKRVWATDMRISDKITRISWQSRWWNHVYGTKNSRALSSKIMQSRSQNYADTTNVTHVADVHVNDRRWKWDGLIFRKWCGWFLCKWQQNITVLRTFSCSVI